MSDNTTTNPPTAGEVKSSTNVVPSSSDGSTTSSGVNTSIVTDQGSSDKLNVQQASSGGQQYNVNYQGYGNNNYNNYNNTSGNNNYYNNKNQYHKNHSGNGGRQNNYNNNNSNNNANPNNNPRYNNNKKQYNNQKLNHHHHNHHNQQQQGQQSYINYGGYNAGAPVYGYYQYPPVFVQGLPMQYSMAAAPAQQYAPVPPPGAASQPKPISTPPTPKIKLTTKDGKPVDLEEKKRQTASSTPVGSVHPTVATTTVNNEKEKTPTSAPAASIPATEAKSTGLSAAEEFKRRIRERAAAAAKGKVEKDSSDKPDSKAAIESQSSTTETAKEEVKSEPVEATNENTKISTETTLDTKEQESETAEPKEQEQPIEEEKQDQETAPETTETPEVIEDSTQGSEAGVTPEIEAELEQQPEAEQEPEPEKEQEQASEIAKEEGDQPKEAEEIETTSSEEVKDEESTAEAETDSVSQFGVTQFLERLNTVSPIDDILTTKYPEGIQGVDSSKQIPGKKYRYDPQFLIQFREVVTYNIDPAFKARLDSLDIHANTMKRAGSTRDQSRGGLPGKFPGGIPARFNGPGGKGGSPYDGGRQNSRSGSKRGGRGASSRDKSSRKGGQSKRGGRGDRNDMREKTEEELAKEGKPVEEVKPLEKSANRWVPKSRMQKREQRVAEDGSIILEKEDIERKINSLLNKLTLEMFTAISDEIIAVGDQAKWEKDAETIKQIISLIFAKACDEPHWSEMYAKLCAKMCTTLSNDIKDESSKLKDGTHPAGGQLARRILLTTCQREYEKGWSDKLPTNEDGSPLEPEMMSDEYYAMAAAKRRGLGLVKFIGHLYNLSMLNNQVIFVCLKDQSRNTVDPSEDSLENLAQLIQTVGPKLDADESTRGLMKLVFDYIERVLQDVKLPSRIKFMLMDMQDLRKAKWASNKADAGPKTIEEIHRDAEIKKMEDEKAKNDKKRKQQQYGNDSRSGSSRGGSAWNNNNNNQSSNFVKKSPSFVNPRAASSRSPSAPSTQNTDIQRETSKRSDSTQVNRFAALHHDNDDDE